jgi:hypothetical protein
LAVAAVALSVFMFSAFWIYHYVDLEQDTGELGETENNESLNQALPPLSQGQGIMNFHRS